MAALASLADRPDYQRLVALRVAGREHAIDRSCKANLADRDIATRIKRNALLLEQFGAARRDEREQEFEAHFFTANQSVTISPNRRSGRNPGCG